MVQRVLSEVPRDRYISAPAFQLAPDADGFNLVVGPETAAVNQHALDQVAQRAGMQLRYLHDLVDKGQGWARELAADRGRRSFAPTVSGQSFTEPGQLHPRDKAKAEVGVQIAQRWILARLGSEVFHSLDALNAGSPSCCRT